MKAEKIDWSVLQGAIMVFVISILICVTLIGTTWYYNERMLLEHNRQKGQFQNISNQYLAIDQEEKLIRQYYPDFIKLHNKGIIGPERRLSWIETLRNVGENIKLPVLRYGIDSQSRFVPDYPVNTGPFLIYSSPMKLNIDLLHEGDLKKLLDTLNTEAPGIYNVSKCIFRRSGEISTDKANKGNISAECELRWLNIKRPNGSDIDLSL
jgi:hypothetical protein